MIQFYPGAQLKMSDMLSPKAFCIVCLNPRVLESAP